MIRTEICDLLGIEYPIFQGGMAWVSDASLAGAVSNAGGLGIIAGMNSNGEQLRAEIQKIREITDKPFGVNVMLLSPFADEVAQVVVEEKVPVVVTGAGLPSKYIKNWVENGLKVIPVVPSVAIARMCERMGACAVVAEGGAGCYVAMPIHLSPKFNPQTNKEASKMETNEIKETDSRRESANEALDPMEELNHGIDELRGKLKLLLDETGVLTRKVKEAVLKQKQKERDFILAKRAIERIKMAI